MAPVIATFWSDSGAGAEVREVVMARTVSPTTDKHQ